MKQSRIVPQSGVTFDVFYPHSPERVWRALTDPTALARWLMPTDFRPVLGHRFQFRERIERRGGPAPGTETVNCEVVALEEARRLAYTWQSERDPEPTLVTLTLEPVEGGTRLQLDHTVFIGPQSLIFRAQAAMNWQATLTVDLTTELDLAGPQRRPRGLILLPAARQAVRCVGRYHVPTPSGTR